MFILKIGRTVEKLLLGVFFHQNSPVAPLELNIENFNGFVLLRLSDESIAILCVKLVELLQSYSRGVFFKI
jgi:hypothetical protein